MKNFTTLSNAVINDDRLSFRARGVLMHLLSKPDEWEPRSVAIAAQSPREGRDAIRTAMRELEEFGYLTRERVRNADGTFEMVQIIHGIPADPSAAPGPGNPEDDSSGAGESGSTQRTGSSPRTDTNTPPNPQPKVTPIERAPKRVGVVVSAHAEGRLDALALACREHGLAARWDRLKPDQAADITALLETHGVAALADAARDAHRSSNPTRYAQGLIGAWSALPTSRRTKQGPPSPAELRRACADCVGGWVEDSAGLPIRRCTCQTAVAA